MAKPVSHQVSLLFSKLSNELQHEEQAQKHKQSFTHLKLLKEWVRIADRHDISSQLPRGRRRIVLLQLLASGASPGRDGTAPL